jgi:hypothetical protein
MLLPPLGTNTLFDTECKRLTIAGVPAGMIDMIGDGNCLYYAMIHYLAEVDDRILLTIGSDYPQVWLRKLLRNFANKMHSNYWDILLGGDREVKLNSIFDPTFNYMDETLTRHYDHVDKQGEITDVYIFAALFQVRAVVYAAAATPKITYYIDGRKFRENTGRGLLTTAKEGLLASQVPSGPSIFTVVNYITDDVEDGTARGTPHWIRVEPPMAGLEHSAKATLIEGLCDCAPPVPTETDDDSSVHYSTDPDIPVDGSAQSSPAKEQNQQASDKDNTTPSDKDEGGNDNNRAGAENGEGEDDQADDAGDNTGGNDKDGKEDDKDDDKEKKKEVNKNDKKEKAKTKKKKEEEEAAKLAKEQNKKEKERKAELAATQQRQEEKKAAKEKQLEEEKALKKKEEEEGKANQRKESEEAGVKKQKEIQKFKAALAVKLNQDKNEKSAKEAAKKQMKEEEEASKEKRLKEEKEDKKKVADEKKAVLAKKKEEIKARKKAKADEKALAKAKALDLKNAEDKSNTDVKSLASELKKKKKEKDDKQAEEEDNTTSDQEKLALAVKEGMALKTSANKSELESAAKGTPGEDDDLSNVAKGTKGGGNKPEGSVDSDNDSQKTDASKDSIPSGDRKPKAKSKSSIERGKQKQQKKDDLPTKRNRAAIDRWKPDAFARAPQKAKRKRQAVDVMDRGVSAVYHKALKAGIDEPNPETKNLIAASFPSKTPLTFLANNEENLQVWPIDEGYGELQLNFTPAFKEASASLNIPTRGLLNRCRESKILRRWTGDALHLARLEADLRQIKNVKQIAWIPEKSETTGKRTQKTLKGMYQVKVLRQSGATGIVNVRTDWVEKNFIKAALGAVQRAAYQVLELMEGGDANLSEEQRSGFLEVECAPVTVSAVDKRVINRLKYTKPKKRKGRTLKGRWWGYTNDTKEYILLTTEWVEKNFDHNFLIQVKNRSGDNNAFVSIPPGDSRSHSKTIITGGPRIHYKQKEGERTCMVYAAASALHYLGWTNVAAWAYNQTKHYINDPNAFHKFVQELRKRNKKLRTTKEKGVNTAKTMNLGEAVLQGLLLVRILGSDGKDDHCVALTQEWIFDSNFKYALPRSRQSLDSCCSSDDIPCTYVRAVDIAHFPRVTKI